MTLLRAAARTMLASYFIASGVKALRDPDAQVPDAEPLTDKMVPLVKDYAPEQVASFIPEDTRTLVRVHGATQVVGGLALAAADTEGKPSLAWRAQRGGKSLAKSTGKLAKKAESLTEGGSDFAESALAGGADLVGTVVASTRKA